MNNELTDLLEGSRISPMLFHNGSLRGIREILSLYKTVLSKKDVADEFNGFLKEYDEEYEPVSGRSHLLLPFLACEIIVPHDGLVNALGTVSVAELLYGIGCLKEVSDEGVTDEAVRKDDYFSNGYFSCQPRISGMYSREELVQPVTRLELAYLTLICWNGFQRKPWDEPEYGVLFPWMGYSVSEYPDLPDFERVPDSCVCNMKEHVGKAASGEELASLDEAMSLVTLAKMGILTCDNGLEPFRQVTREEFCVFLCMLAQAI